ncbi:Gfo/Idh/MocA family protein [Prosthecomicrobium pneumaticum]|uniref:Putative dehydrogenase n=1 Tax=Prosthecomicrobium pneumaticum TaxID=81895 RepID=A0A7W9FLL5_9HYPH|nr:Gfo/Idh/MocA family oxidoreductase [Prosthecomicrobium pneumaticum]MBB5752924.1 putative dehydrogenase [Prosthecomicrobium pneumaticum]
MSERPIGVGVIGCGEIAQLMHLPYLHELPEFRIAALCDISPTLVETLGDHYGVARRTTDHRELLADPKVDAVVICTYDHGPIVADTIAAGKHFIVEKPLAFTPEEARPLVERAREAGLVAMVGYMKLFDPGYEYGRARIAAIGKPASIRVHDFAGRFDRYGALYSQIRPADVPADRVAAGRAAVEARIDAMLGPDHAGYRDLYFTILMLGSHDLAVLRAAFGAPEGVAYARAIGPNHVMAVLDYPGGVPALLEIAFGAQYEWWDEGIEVRGRDETVRIAFQNPYWRNASAIVHIQEAAGDGPSERIVPGVPDTSFRREWKHFAAAIRSDEPVRSTLEGGLDDLELALAIVRALPPKGRA